MSNHRRCKKLDLCRQPEPDETLTTYISLGRRLAAQMAETNFRTLTAEPGWTAEQVEIATEDAITRMDVGARDLLIAKGADHGGEHWQAIWTAMETGYRETMAALLGDASFRGPSTLQ